MDRPSKRSPAARAAFAHYLRTGRWLPDEMFAPDNEVELKFNPYHDPRNGQFTFAPGGSRSLAHVTVSQSRKPAPPHPDRKDPASAKPARGASEGISGISLTRTHRTFLSYAERFPAKTGTQDVWTGEISKAAFKDQFIAGHRNAILAAAKLYDVPAPLVASVAYVELGSDDWKNDAAYVLRAEGGRSIPRALGLVESGQALIDNLNRPRAETSFGPYNIQQRRAAEILGYGDINKMSETAKRTLVPTTREPVPATFMLAKHLSDLRNQDFPGVKGKDLTFKQMLVVATRYNIGPDKSYKEILDKIEKGEEYLNHILHVMNFVRHPNIK